MSSPHARKLSQRQTLSCLACAQSKVRCDKKIPCQRCISRGKGHLCSRPAVQLSTRRAVADQGGQLRALENLRDYIQTARLSPEHLLGVLEERIAEIGCSIQETTRQHPLVGVSSATSVTSGVPNNGPINHGNDHGGGNQEETTTSPQGTASESTYLWQDTAASSPSHADEQVSPEQAGLALTLEYLAWGRNYKHQELSSHQSRPGSATAVVPTVAGSRITSQAAARLGLPAANIARRLVDFHIHYVCWYHNSIHSPSFLEQCQIFWRDGTMDSPSWISLYLVVLATAAWCLPIDELSDSWDCDPSLAHILERPRAAAEQWYNAMINTLYQNNYMANHSIHSVQAIVISTIIAHPLGHSNSHYILLGSAIRIAQCLGLDKLKEDASERTAATSADNWGNLVRLQLGRRVWWQLIIQDYFAIPFADTYNHFTTSLPWNCDDHDLKDLPSHEPTISSYCLVLAKMARLMPKLVDGGNGRHGKQDAKHYQCVLDVDINMRSLVSRIPPFLLRHTPRHPSHPGWVSWARKTLTISAADKIIMIHRAFLVPSFRNPMYAYTRTTSLSASLTILREFERIRSSNEANMWVVPAFVISAGIIVCLDLLFRSQATAETSRNRQLVRAAVFGLADAKGNRMAARGARILEALLEEEQERRNSGPSCHALESSTVDLGKVRRHLKENEDGQESGSGMGSHGDGPPSCDEGGCGQHSLQKTWSPSWNDHGPIHGAPIAATANDVAQTSGPSIPFVSDGSGASGGSLEQWVNSLMSWNASDSLTLYPSRSESFTTNYGEDVFGSGQYSYL